MEGQTVATYPSSLIWADVELAREPSGQGTLDLSSNQTCNSYMGVLSQRDFDTPCLLNLDARHSMILL